MALPYKAHPIYFLRKLIIISAAVGIFLCCITYSPYNGEVFTLSIICLFFSALVAMVDLFCYATKKLEHPDEDPKWPTRKWMVLDFVLAIGLQLVFWAAVSALSWSYGYDNMNVIGAYGVLADFVCSVLHGWAFWKQLMARYKKKWLRTLPSQPCARCGYIDGEEQSSEVPRHNILPPNIHPYAGPSASTQAPGSPQFTPASPESAMEEGLLIGSDFGTGYGSFEPSEPTLDQPEEVVVGKSKKKKTQVGGGTKSAGKKPDRA